MYENICKDASLKDTKQCLKLLKANPQISSAKDYYTICKLFLETAVEKATKAQNYLKILMRKYPSSIAIKKCSTNCYNEMVEFFKGSLNDLIRDPLSANYLAARARDGPVACETVLASEKIVNTSSISTLNHHMKILSLVAYLATNHLPGLDM